MLFSIVYIIYFLVKITCGFLYITEAGGRTLCFVSSVCSGGVETVNGSLVITEKPNAFSCEYQSIEFFDPESTMS